MHYANGQPAQLGDVVKGNPYNGDPRVVVGRVIGLENTDRLNIRLAVMDSMPFAPGEPVIQRRGIVWPDGSREEVLHPGCGECEKFDLLYREPAEEISAPVTAGEIEEVNDSSPVEE